MGNLESEEDVSPVGLRLIQREYFEFIEMLPKRGSEAEEVLEQSGLWTEVKTEADTKDLMKSGTSSVVLLSYRWRSASHPDPDGTVLACVKEFLAREENAAIEVGRSYFPSLETSPQRIPFHSHCAAISMCSGTTSACLAMLGTPVVGRCSWRWPTDWGCIL